MRCKNDEHNKVFGIFDSDVLGEIYKVGILDDTSTRLESN